MFNMNKRIGALASVVTLLTLIARFGVNRIAEWGNNIPVWAPTFGTIGETVTLYNLGAEIVEPLVPIVLSLGLGYQVGRRFNVTREYSRVVTSVIVGSILVIAVWTVLTQYMGASISDGFDVLLVIASFVSTFVSTTLVITVGTLAGVALAHFRTKASSPSKPTTANREQTTPDNRDFR